VINDGREFLLRSQIDHQLKTPGATEPEAFAEYLRCYDSEATVHAICEDYRAAAGIDLQHDADDAARRISAPLLVLWGARDSVGKMFDVLACWRERAMNVEGEPIDCGHTPQEEKPDDVHARLLSFLGSSLQSSGLG
jgi:haloacetate dehalogenase